MHEKPPPAIKDIYKLYQKLDRTSLEERPDLIHLGRISDHNHLLNPSKPQLLPAELRQSFLEFLGLSESDEATELSSDKPNVFEVASIPGLFIYPSLLPPKIQVDLLAKLFHRDLCNPEHKTNVHLHHHVPYSEAGDDDLTLSYFDSSSQKLLFAPQDATVHKPFTTEHFLEKKLRWMTLGGQYDWTNKVYPSGPPPAFPQDIKNLIEDIFPMKAEAAIVNLYSPGDTLSLHRDVSEECDQPLVSISIGCDGIFVIGLDELDDNGEPRIATIRLRSGDAVLMSDQSRFAWHAVPKVLEGTCPKWLENWPSLDENENGGVEDRFEHWKGWMKEKRVNLNVRQMFA